MDRSIRDDRFNYFLTFALVAHFIIVGLGIVLTQVLNLDFTDLKIKNENVELINSAVRVDIVDMPKLTVQELKKIKYVPPSPVEVQKVDKEPQKVNETSKVEFKKVSKNKVDLTNLLSNLSQKNLPQKKVKKPNKMDQKVLRSLILEGNKVSKGSSVVGDKTAVSEQAFVAYLQGLPQAIRPNWKLPSYLLDQNLRCRIKIFIGSGGKLLKTQMYESSGVPEFDQKALSAVNLSAPYPAPPEDIRLRVSSGEVIIGFPL